MAERVPEYLIDAADNYCVKCWTEVIQNTGIRVDCHGISCPMATLNHYFATDKEYREAFKRTCEDCPSFCSREDCGDCDLFQVRKERERG